MVKRGIPLAAMERIFHAADSEIRVSEAAKEELKRALEQDAAAIAAKAWKLAEHAGRRTVKAEDILLAAEHVKE